MLKKKSVVSEQVGKDKNEDVPYYDSDLLVTKKVVILTENEEGAIVERKKRSKLVPGRTKKISKQERIRRFKERISKARATKRWGGGKTKRLKKMLGILKPCYVEMVRDECVEEAYRKYRKELISRKIVGLQNKRNVNINNSVTKSSSVKFPPRKLEGELLPKQDRYFQNIKNMFFLRVIKTDERFEREMNLLKPILLVQEHNLRSIDYSEEFSKNNIVYIARKKEPFPKSILVNEQFISAVELGYIKLIDSSLFCKFVNGGMELSNRRHISDHSYCLNKK